MKNGFLFRVWKSFPIFQSRSILCQGAMFPNPTWQAAVQQGDSADKLSSWNPEKYMTLGF